MYGGSPCASSIAVIPNDQISALTSYPADCLITSGAIQYYIRKATREVTGVPTNVFFLVMLDVSCPDTPKSASLTSPASVKSKLAAFYQSRCICSTFDITVDFSFRMEICQTKKHLAKDDGYVSLWNEIGFHLNEFRLRMCYHVCTTRPAAVFHHNP